MLAHPIVQKSPLRARDSFYGGPIEAMRLHYKAREIETIQYVDVMRLSPYIRKYFMFPVVHPVIHVGDACNDKEACLRMDGLIKCSIVPSQKLCHPVLPFRYYNKLIICLYRTCVFTSSVECVHTPDEDRDLTGTWVMDTVSLAVENG